MMLRYMFALWVCCCNIQCVQTLYFSDISKPYSKLNLLHKLFSKRLQSESFSPLKRIAVAGSNRESKNIASKQLNYFFLRDELKLHPKTLNRILIKSPSILYLKVEENLRPTIQTFRSFGFKMSDIRKMINFCPSILAMNEEWTIPEKLISIQKLFYLSRSSMIKLVINYPYLLTSSVDRHIRVANIFSDTIGLKPSQIRKLISEKYQRLIYSNPQIMKESWEILTDVFGFSDMDARKIFLSCPTVFTSIMVKTCDRRLELFNKEMNIVPPFEDMKLLIIRFPYLLAIDIDYFLLPNFHLLKKYLLFSASDLRKVILHFPRLLAYNPSTLERKLCQVLFMLTASPTYSAVSSYIDSENINDYIDSIFSVNTLKLYSENQNKNNTLSDVDLFELDVENDQACIHGVDTEKVEDIDSDFSPPMKDLYFMDISRVEMELPPILHDADRAALEIIRREINKLSDLDLFTLPSDHATKFTTNGVCSKGDTKCYNQKNEDLLIRYLQESDAISTRKVVRKSSFSSLNIDQSQLLSLDEVKKFDILSSYTNAYDNYFNSSSISGLKLEISEAVELEAMKRIMKSFSTLKMDEERARYCLKIFAPILSYDHRRGYKVMWAIALSLGMTRLEMTRIAGIYPRLFSLSVDLKLTSLLTALGDFALKYLKHKNNRPILDKKGKSMQRLFNRMDFIEQDYDYEAMREIVEDSDRFGAQFDMNNFIDDFVCNRGDDEVMQAISRRRNHVVRVMIRECIIRFPILLGMSMDRIKSRLDEISSNPKLLDVFDWEYLIAYIRRDDELNREWIETVTSGNAPVALEKRGRKITKSKATSTSSTLAFASTLEPVTARSTSKNPLQSRKSVKKSKLTKLPESILQVLFDEYVHKEKPTLFTTELDTNNEVTEEFIPMSKPRVATTVYGLMFNVHLASQSNSDTNYLGGKTRLNSAKRRKVKRLLNPYDGDLRRERTNLEIVISRTGGPNALLLPRLSGSPLLAVKDEARYKKSLPVRV